MLDKYLGNVDTERLAKLPKIQKVQLLASLMKTFGITANELTSLRAQVSRQLKGSEVTPDAGMAEGVINELELDNSTSSDKLGALGTKKEKMEKTQAYQMMIKALENRPASAQADFVLQLLQSLPLDDSAKTKIKMKIRQELQ